MNVKMHKKSGVGGGLGTERVEVVESSGVCEKIRLWETLR
jgi:hypothetical protein